MPESTKQSRNIFTRTPKFWSYCRIRIQPSKQHVSSNNVWKTIANSTPNIIFAIKMTFQWTFALHDSKEMRSCGKKILCQCKTKNVHPTMETILFFFYAFLSTQTRDFLTSKKPCETESMRKMFNCIVTESNCNCQINQRIF